MERMSPYNYRNINSTPVAGNMVWKLVLVGVLVLILNIPLLMVDGLLVERKQRKTKVINEISRKWGGAQTVIGPVLSIPIKRKPELVNKDNPDPGFMYLHLSPETMTVTGKFSIEKRKRGIFEAPGYVLDLDITGKFPEVRSEYLPSDRLPTGEYTTLSMNITDNHGIKILTGTLDGRVLDFNHSQGLVTQLGEKETGTGDYDEEMIIPKDKSDDFVNLGLTATDFKPISRTPVFHIKARICGMQNIRFLCGAMNQTVKLEGNWPTPSFAGTILPDKRVVSKSGFTAEWQTQYIASGVRQSWTSDDKSVAAALVGVDFLTIGDAYKKTDRILKYGILFIILTFLTFFFTEVITRNRIHPVQYLMVGVAIVIFYMLLLSVSERIDFGWAYLLSSLAVILQVSLYSRTILRMKFFALLVGILLTIFYSFFYVLLHLEDSSLIVGSVGLFAILGVAMYLLRKVKWYSNEPVTGTGASGYEEPEPPTDSEANASDEEASED